MNSGHPGRRGTIGPQAVFRLWQFELNVRAIHNWPDKSPRLVEGSVVRCKTFYVEPLGNKEHHPV